MSTSVNKSTKNLLSYKGKRDGWQTAICKAEELLACTQGSGWKTQVGYLLPPQFHPQQHTVKTPPFMGTGTVKNRCVCTGKEDTLVARILLQKMGASTFSMD
jgi:hypothetical protein